MSDILAKNGNVEASGGESAANRPTNGHTLDFSEITDENGLRLMLAREAIQLGKMPDRVPDFLSQEPAEGEQCAVCGLSFTEDELVCKLKFAQNRRDLVSRHLHIRCFAAWESECQNGSVDGKASEKVQTSGPGQGGA